MTEKFDVTTARLVHGPLSSTHFLSPGPARNPRGRDDTIVSGQQPGTEAGCGEPPGMGVPAAQGRATPLELVATVGHALSGAEAWLHLDCLRNPLAGGHSGSIRVRLIASSRPIGDSPFEYWDLAHFALDVLPAGESHRHVDRVVGLTLPPDGIYHLALGVFEFDSRQPLGGARSEWLVDHCTFAGLLTVQAGRILGSAARSVVMRAAPPATSGRRSWFPWLKPRTARFA